MRSSRAVTMSWASTLPLVPSLGQVSRYCLIIGFETERPGTSRWTDTMTRPAVFERESLCVREFVRVSCVSMARGLVLIYGRGKWNGHHRHARWCSPNKRASLPPPPVSTTSPPGRNESPVLSANRDPLQTRGTLEHVGGSRPQWMRPSRAKFLI